MFYDLLRSLWDFVFQNSILRIAFIRFIKEFGGMGNRSECFQGTNRMGKETIKILLGTSDKVSRTSHVVARKAILKSTHFSVKETVYNWIAITATYKGSYAGFVKYVLKM